MVHFTTQHRRFEGLMKYRVREVLLVSSAYDHFTLEEDGRLNEVLLLEYRQLHLTQTPRLTHVTTAEAALERLKEQNFDLVVTMTRVGEIAVHVFGKLVKELRPGLPVVLLAYNTRELALFKEGEGIDRVFVWSGDASILLAIFKLVEDLKNVEQDTRHGDVQVLILVEDSVRFYSVYLPLLYHELLKQTQTLMAEGINLHHKLLRMRARTKILLATTMEEALELLECYADYVLGLITDAGFPRGGEQDLFAGPELVKRARALSPHLPVMLQSSRDEMEAVARELGTAFLDKDQPKLLRGLRRFMHVNLGFGDFVFTLPDGTEVGRVRDLPSMLELLPTVPLESVHYHAQRNHFSNWFRARTEFDLARVLQPRTISEFDSLEQVRDYLVETLRAFQLESRRGGVADYSPQGFESEGSFVRVGGGSLGGKGRGLAYFNSLLPTLDLKSRFPDLEVGVPKTAVVGTAVFDEFLEGNDLIELAYSAAEDEEIARAFVAGRLPDSIYDSLQTITAQWEAPLAVRSSSLLEDSQHQPFAGVYHTHMLANNHPDPKVRLQQLCDAVKLVYASTFYRASKAYLAATPNRIEEEKMAVVVQELIGQEKGGVFYPTFAGVARSFNFYPVGDIQPEEGLVVVALGLGKTVVEGGKCLRYSPAHPQQLYQFSSVEETLRSSQREFWALDMRVSGSRLAFDPEANLRRLDLTAAEREGQLYALGSVYSPDNEAIYDGISREGVRLVTFAGVLKHKVFPLTEVLQELLEVGREGFSGPVELEFAVELDPLRKIRRLGFLQIRPLVAEAVDVTVDVAPEGSNNPLCHSPTAMGNGVIDGLYDILYIHPDRLDRARTGQVASDLETLNAKLVEAGRPYLLIGPGRWGSADPWLGIPVAWGQISGARTIVECDLADFKVTPSQGTHFFQNIATFGVGYFTVNEGQGRVDWEWLEGQPVAGEAGPVRHLEFKEPLKVLLDGRSGRGAILKPRAEYAHTRSS